MRAKPMTPDIAGADKGQANDWFTSLSKDQAKN
jgi:hypothetical protein